MKKQIIDRILAVTDDKCVYSSLNTCGVDQNGNITDYDMSVISADEMFNTQINTDESNSMVSNEYQLAVDRCTYRIIAKPEIGQRAVLEVNLNPLGSTLVLAEAGGFKSGFIFNSAFYTNRPLFDEDGHVRILPHWRTGTFDDGISTDYTNEYQHAVKFVCKETARTGLLHGFVHLAAARGCFFEALVSNTTTPLIGKNVQLDDTSGLLNNILSQYENYRTTLRRTYVDIQDLKTKYPKVFVNGWDEVSVAQGMSITDYTLWVALKVEQITLDKDNGDIVKAVNWIRSTIVKPDVLGLGGENAVNVTSNVFYLALLTPALENILQDYILLQLLDHIGDNWDGFNTSVVNHTSNPWKCNAQDYLTNMVARENIRVAVISETKDWVTSNMITIRQEFTVGEDGDTSQSYTMTVKQGLQDEVRTIDQEQMWALATLFGRFHSTWMTSLIPEFTPRPFVSKIVKNGKDEGLMNVIQSISNHFILNAASIVMDIRDQFLDSAVTGQVGAELAYSGAASKYVLLAKQSATNSTIVRTTMSAYRGRSINVACADSWLFTPVTYLNVQRASGSSIPIFDVQKDLSLIAAIKLELK